MSRDQMEQIAQPLGVANQLKTDLHLGEGPKTSQKPQKPKLRDDPSYKGLGSSNNSGPSVNEGLRQTGSSISQS